MAPASVGRIVLYTQPANEIAHNGSKTHPAIVTAVFAPDMANLRVFADLSQGALTPGSVHMKGNMPADYEAENGYWEWPPKVE